MSYSFRVVVEDGRPVVAEGSVSGTVPEGMFAVSGHEDDASASVTLTRYASQTHLGRVVAQASGYAAKA